MQMSAYAWVQTPLNCLPVFSGEEDARYDYKKWQDMGRLEKMTMTKKNKESQTGWYL